MNTHFSKQVGGDHYKNLAIQPAEFIHKNNIGFLAGCVIKRLCRYKRKGGAEDLRKSIHEIEMILAMEYDGDDHAKHLKSHLEICGAGGHLKVPVEPSDAFDTLDRVDTAEKAPDAS